MKKRLAAFIPNYISNKVVLAFFEVLRFFQRTFHICWRSCDKHFEHNREQCKQIVSRAIYDTNSDFIENQKDLSYIQYGKRNLSRSGCEIIAVFNALARLGYKPGLEELISHFEKDGMVLSGKFGTSPIAIKDFFIAKGFEVKMTCHESEFEALALDTSNMILTLYNNRESILNEVHTVFISRHEDGLYAHNVYGNGIVVGPSPNLTELIESFNRGKSKGISLICIHEKTKE